MHKKHLGFVFRSSPYAGLNAREGIEALFASAVFDPKLSVIFRDDGVFQLLNVNTNNEHTKNTSKMLASLPLYGIDELLAEKESLAARKIDISSIKLPLKLFDRSEFHRIAGNCDHILSF